MNVELQTKRNGKKGKQTWDENEEKNAEELETKKKEREKTKQRKK